MSLESGRVWDHEKRKLIYFYGVLDEGIVSEVVGSVLGMLDRLKGNERIKIVMESEGGVLTSGLWLYSFLKMTGKVDTIAGGNVSSAGVIAFLGGKKRFAFEDSTFMLHLGQWNGGGMHFTGERLESQAKNTTLMDHRSMEIVARETTHSVNEIEQIMRERYDWFLTADQALAYKIVHKIVKPKDGLPF